jgi:pilus assembly protein CpaF
VDPGRDGESEPPGRSIGQHIEGGIQFVIQLRRLSDRSRRIVHIFGITGAEGDVISRQDLFVVEREGFGEGGKVLGRFKPTGIRPKFGDAL